jgi:hypothetical protein
VNLLDIAPESVTIGGQVYAFDADFRNAIKFEQLMFDVNVPKEAQGFLVLRLFYPVIPPDLPEALKKVIWFYSCGEDMRPRHGKTPDELPPDNRIYSYEHDAPYIYAAFLAEYGIDLLDVDFLHWWKFRALFQALREDNTICKIMGYRSADLRKLKGDQRKHYEHLKRLYALPKPRGEREKLSEISEALMNGGDIGKILNKKGT